MKLKKSNRRQSQIPEEPKLPTVDLKHHEFEKLPQTEEVLLQRNFEKKIFNGLKLEKNAQLINRRFFEIYIE